MKYNQIGLGVGVALGLVMAAMTILSIPLALFYYNQWWLLIPMAIVGTAVGIERYRNRHR